jgi:hypothetical protein
VEVSISSVGDWHGVVSGDGPIRTPMGTPLVSRHLALVEEVAADVARWGTDPTAKTTAFSLQASYLDFGLRVKREVLEENTAAIWPEDLFVQRPADRGVAAALAALWGELEPGRDRLRFREALRGLTLRQVVACMTAGHVLRSAVLGFEAVTTRRDLVPLARGACGRHFEALVRAVGGDAAAAGRRHVPTDPDEGGCAACCAAPGGEVGPSFTSTCALLPLLEKLRRWSAFPEEVERG